MKNCEKKSFVLNLNLRLIFFWRKPDIGIVLIFSVSSVPVRHYRIASGRTHSPEVAGQPRSPVTVAWYSTLSLDTHSFTVGMDGLDLVVLTSVGDDREDVARVTAKNQSINQSINQKPIDQSINRSVNQSIDRSSVTLRWWLAYAYCSSTNASGSRLKRWISYCLKLLEPKREYTSLFLEYFRIKFWKMFGSKKKKEKNLTFSDIYLE